MKKLIDAMEHPEKEEANGKNNLRKYAMKQRNITKA